MNSPFSLYNTIQNAIKQGNFPFFDDAKKVTGMMRAVGYDSPAGGILLFEQIAIDRSDTIANHLYVYGENRENGLASSRYILNEETFIARPSSTEIESKITGVIYDLSTFRFVNKKAHIPNEFSIDINGSRISVPVEFPKLTDIKLRHKKKHKYLSPSEWVFLQICHSITPNPWILSDTQLKNELNLPQASSPLFTLTKWHHPNAVDSTMTTDVEKLIQAVTEHRSISEMTEKSNTHFGYWLDDQIEMRDEKDWAWGK